VGGKNIPLNGEYSVASGGVGKKKKKKPGRKNPAPPGSRRVDLKRRRETRLQRRDGRWWLKELKSGVGMH